MVENSTKNSSSFAPVAIGGVGGSGTRLIAQVLREIGYYMGGDLNEASDNLWFTLLFKRVELCDARSENDFAQAIEVFRSVMVDGIPLDDGQKAYVRRLAMANRPQHEYLWLRQRAESLIQTANKQNPRVEPWGWKAPNTHIFLDRFARAFPKMKYIHVMRNGLDLAHSSNQNQLRLWGPLLFGASEIDVSPRSSLKFWCLVHRRVISLGEAMPAQFYLLNYDEFCSAPQTGLRGLLGFLNVSVDASTSQRLLDVVRAPASIGRFKQFGVELFNPDDVAYVASLGFEAGCP